MSKDLTFQITDWRSNDINTGDDDEPFYKYRIELYGRTKDDKTVYLQINNYTPYFFVEIPYGWRNSHVKTFIKEITKKVYYKHRCALKTYDIVNRHKFYGFTNFKTFNFVRLIFHSYAGFRKFRWAIQSNHIYHPSLGKKGKMYKLYESNIEPMLRFMHIRDLEACGWAKVPHKKYKLYDEVSSPSINDINATTKWTNILKVDDSSISPIVIASYDIECTSGDGSFPQANRDTDKVIQIGTTFSRYGESECFYKHIITLGSCDPIDGVDVESYHVEKKVLLAWTELMKRMNPDIITGYNIFGFDYKYLHDRSKKLGVNHKFIKLCRIKNKSSYFDEKGKKLSSAALGSNLLYYYQMSGRIQIDLMKVVQKDYNLGSYKLDNVAAHFIRGNIKDIQFGEKTVIKTSDVYGLKEDQYITIYYNDGLTDNLYLLNGKSKFKIHKLNDDSIIIKEKPDISELKLGKNKVFWCQAKDDVKPQDIFRLQKGTSTDRSIIAKYCIQDCELVSKLVNKLQVIPNNVGMANVCHVPLSYLFLRGQGVKIFSLVAKKCREKNHLIPVIRKKKKDEEIDIKPKKTYKYEIEEDSDHDDEPEKYEGATVLEPTVGVHFRPIAVLDYASLYPSSMIMRNFSHECYVNDKKYLNLPNYTYYTVPVRKIDEEKLLKKVNQKYAFDFTSEIDFQKINSSNVNNQEETNDETYNYYTFAQNKNGKPGIIPEILINLLTARSNTKKKMKIEKNPFKKNIFNGLQLAYKITANSVYGQTGALTSSICCIPIASSTTATGRQMLNLAKLFTEHIFYKIIKPILNNDKKIYKKRINYIFDKKIDKILGKKAIKKLKKNKDYDYFSVLYEKEELTDEHFINNKLKHTCKKDFIEYFYKEIKRLLKNKSIKPKSIYGDTDSVFNDYHIKDLTTGKELENKEGLIIAIRLGVLNGELIKLVLPSPQDLEYEKTFWPFCILTKKRYVGNLYELDPNKYYQKSMGIVLKRRDNAPIVKIVCGGIIDCILNERSAVKAIEFLKETLKKILSNKYPIDKYIISKTLRAEYKDRTRIVQAILADRMGERDPGNKPQCNDRIPFVYYITNKPVKLQGDRVEHPDYVIENNLKLDYLFYITNQIQKPATQFLELLAENPECVFNAYIAREKNRRLHKRPVTFYTTKCKDINSLFSKL
jgi:DNA polymerase elongation subunit (family B)